MPDTLSQRYKELFERISNFAREKKFEQINDLLRNNSPNDEDDCAFSIGLLRYTYSLKNKLEEWNPAFRRISKSCEEIYGVEKAKSLLRGLSEEPFVPMFGEASNFITTLMFGEQEDAGNN